MQLRPAVVDVPPWPVDQLARPGLVVVLVGPAGSGKTTVREHVVAAGLPADQVVSLDELRAEARAADVLAGLDPRPLQDYSLRAVRAAEQHQAVLLDQGRGYLADATHLRRRDRVGHVRAATAAGLPAVAVLMPHLGLDVLAARNARRPVDRRVPDDVLARHVHRRSLLDAGLLADEGFAGVHEIPPR